MRLLKYPPNLQFPNSNLKTARETSRRIVEALKIQNRPSIDEIISDKSVPDRRRSCTRTSLAWQEVVPRNHRSVGWLPSRGLLAFGHSRRTRLIENPSSRESVGIKE